MSLTTTQRAPGPASGESTGEPAQRYDDWAICCSGGGIRSATYCLGGLQSLDGDLHLRERLRDGVRQRLVRCCGEYR